MQQLGVNDSNYKQPNYNKTQEIGAAVAFIGCDGLIVPSARWHCDNLILFSDNSAFDVETIVTGVEEVEWEVWAKENGVID